MAQTIRRPGTALDPGRYYRPDRWCSRHGPRPRENAVEKDCKSAEGGPGVRGDAGQRPPADRPPFVRSRVRRVTASQARWHRVARRVDKPARVVLCPDRRSRRPRRAVGDRGDRSKCACAPRPSSGKRPTRVEGDRQRISGEERDSYSERPSPHAARRTHGVTRFSGDRSTGRPEITVRDGSL